MKFTAEHDALRRTARQFVENELNPFIPEWEGKRQGVSQFTMYLKKWQTWVCWVFVNLKKMAA